MNLSLPFGSVNEKSQDNKGETIFRRRISGIRKELAGLLKSTEKQKGDRQKEENSPNLDP
jgi:hypothetical protein